MGAFHNPFSRPKRGDGRRTARLAAAFALALACAGIVEAASVGGASLSGGEVSILLEERGDGIWRLVYRLPRAVKQLDLGPDLGGYRSRAWRVRMEDAELAIVDGRDIIRARHAGERFSAVVIDVLPTRIDQPRTYEAFIPMGPEGSLVYTGHFQPMRRDGARYPTRITIEPRRGRRVAAFDSVAPRLDGWASRFDNPAFVYVGSAPVIRTGSLVAAIAPATPTWAANELQAASEAALRHLGGRFGWALDATPNLFVSYEPGGAPGHAMFSGDALPAQFRVALAGGAWERPTAFARDVLRAGVAHEAAHLWQTAARPFAEDAPDWIHEGGANAIAAETMMALGWWTTEDAVRDHNAARRTCFGMIRGASLPAVEAAGETDASYACGQVLNELAARAHPEGAIGFWNEFIDRARAGGGYDANLFFDVAADLGGEAFARELRRFALLPQSRPADAVSVAEGALRAGGGRLQRRAAGAPSIANAGDD